MDLAIITSGIQSVPATLGGAAECLIENFLNTNEKYKKLTITVFSIWDAKAYELAQKYNDSTFIFIKPNWLVKSLDNIVYFLAKNILCLKKTISYRYIFQRLYFLNKVSILLKKNDYQKLLTENHPTLLLALKWRKNDLKYKGRYYHHLHNKFAGAFGCASIMKKSQNIICNSNFVLTHLSKTLQIDNNLSVLKNCIDQSKFAKQLTAEETWALKEKYKIAENEKVILFTGRISEEKGIKELVLALKQIKYPNYKLLIVGSSFFRLEAKSRYEKEITEIVECIKDRVIFTGYVLYDKIPDLYAIADIAVLPSMWEEPAGLTIIEAMTSGLPVITTNSGGIPEYANKKCAFILEKDDNLVNNIAKSIDTLLSNDSLREKMGKESLVAVKELNLDNYYLNLLSLLNK